jgi:tRNA(Ile)-lysidine synthase
VPPWARTGMPRVYCGDALAAVACAGVDTSFLAAPGEAGVALEWRPV